MDRTQLITAGAGEFGVKSQHLYREVDLVDYALAGRLHFGPKFEIGFRIIEAVSIAVMDIFTFSQWAAKYFHHYQSVFEFFFSASQVYSNVSAGMQKSFGINGRNASTFVPTFARTESLFFVVTRVSSIFGRAKTTFFGLPTQLALKSRWRTFFHGHTLARATSVSTSVLCIGG